MGNNNSNTHYHKKEYALETKPERYIIEYTICNNIKCYNKKYYYNRFTLKTIYIKTCDSNCNCDIKTCDSN